MKKGLLAVGGVAALGTLAFFGTRKANAAETPKGQTEPTPGEEKPIPLDVARRMAEALATNDSAVVRALAAQLRKEGFLDSASDLEKAAQAIDSLRASGKALPKKSPGLPSFTNDIPPTRKKRGPDPKPVPKKVPGPIDAPDPNPPVMIKPPGNSVQVPDVPTPTKPPPAVRAPSVPVAPVKDARTLLAEQTAAMLRKATKGTEDQGLVKAFQTQEGLKPSGFYGPGSGLAFLKYNIIPPKPFYFPTRGTADSKNNYRKNLLFQAQKDPARAAEWQAAAIV